MGLWWPHTAFVTAFRGCLPFLARKRAVSPTRIRFFPGLRIHAHTLTGREKKHMDGTQNELIAEGMDAFKAKADRRRAHAIKEARDLGVTPEFYETVSDWSLAQIERCPFLFRAAKELNIGPTATNPNLAYGKAVHDAFEVLAKGGDEEKATKAFADRWNRYRGIDFTGRKFAFADFEAMGAKSVTALSRELDGSEIIPESVEHWFDHAPIKNPITGETLADFKFAGRCDLARTKPGDPGIPIEDLKTAASKTNPKMMGPALALNGQMDIYAWLAQNDSLLGEYDLGKYVGRIEVNKAKGAVLAVRFPLREVTQEDIARLYYRVRDAVMRILTYRAQEEAGVPIEQAWPRNSSACEGKYGLCDLAPFCFPHLFPETNLREEFGQKTFD